jgi:hypothetical protein
MRKIRTLEEAGNYKYIIGLTPQDARVLKTSLSYLPDHASNQPEIQSLMKAVGAVSAIKEEIEINNIFNSNSSCDVCED